MLLSLHYVPISDKIGKDKPFSFLCRSVNDAGETSCNIDNRNKRINVKVSDPGHHIQILSDKENSQSRPDYFIRFLLVYGSDQVKTL